MLEYYNLALVPVKRSLSVNCTALAQDNFASQYSEYILGPQALAHVTLCQFTGSAAPVDMIKERLSPVTMDLQFSGIYLKPGVKIHQGKYWVGLSVRPATHLLELQKQMCEMLVDCGLTSLTDSNTYLPHLTLARLETADPITLSVLPEQDMFFETHQFALTIGASNELGMYSRVLWT